MKSYKDWVRTLTTSIGRGGVKFCAEIAGCQPSYLSQVLNGDVHLTSDHLLRLCRQKSLSDDKIDFLFLLYNRDRAGSEEAIRYFSTRIEDAKNSARSISAIVKSEGDLTDHQKYTYFSDWMISAVHLACSFTRPLAPEEISLKIGKTEEQVHHVLELLSDMGLVESQNGIWRHTGKSIHVPNDSLFFKLNHQNWRQYATDMVKQQIRPSESNSINYSSVFTLSKKNLELVRSQILELVKLQRETIFSSEVDEVLAYCLIDLHSW